MREEGNEGRREGGKEGRREGWKGGKERGMNEMMEGRKERKTE